MGPFALMDLLLLFMLVDLFTPTDLFVLVDLFMLMLSFALMALFLPTDSLYPLVLMIMLFESLLLDRFVNLFVPMDISTCQLALMDRMAPFMLMPPPPSRWLPCSCGWTPCTCSRW